MMVEARKDEDREPVAEAAATDLSRFAEVSSKLFAEQAAVLAVMTAYGISVAAQMTGMMLGSLRGPAETEGAAEPKPAEQKTAAPAAQPPTAKVLPLCPRPEASPAPAAVVVAPAQKAARTPKAKVAAAKPAVSKAKPATAKTASSSGDDLKKISGIGPRLAQELNARGIRRYADVAALSKAAAKKLDDELGLEGRVVRDDWAGQAKALSGGKG